MATTDALLARLIAEQDERNAFIDGLSGDAESAGRDLNDTEMGLIARAQERITALQRQIDPLREAARVQRESRDTHAAIAADTAARGRLEDARRTGRVPDEVMYRSAGAYAIDAWKAALGDEDSRQRLGVFRRAAAHQTTADNLGIIPEPVVGPVVQFVDAARPVVTFFGPQPLPGGPTFTRPKVTQHTQVAAQSAEKTELASRKMLISDLTATVSTYGGYVNVSRQNIDWSAPNIMDVVVADLASQYAIQTEAKACADLDAATTAGPTIPTGTPTPQAVSGAIWTAAASAYTAVKGQGRLGLLVSPDMLGMVGPLFAPVNPQNAQSTGFSAGQFGQGAMGAISGITVIMSAGFDAGTMIVASTAAFECWEQRIGQLSVTEPSVLGVQVAYAGYFTDLVVEPGGIIEITKTP